jgi:iron(III) transport system permease protein
MVAGTVLVMANAYLNEKVKCWPGLRKFNKLLALLPLALPGLVIGLGYIFFFNQKWFTLLPGLRLVNPFHSIYGTVFILVLANVVHFFPVPYLTATGALKKLDPEFEGIARTMGVPFYKSFFTVTLPLCLPALLEIAAYFFINAMVTISAVIFLYSAQWKLAAISIVNLEESGDLAMAAALTMLLFMSNLLVKIIFEGIRLFLKKTWLKWPN